MSFSSLQIPLAARKRKMGIARAKRQERDMMPVSNFCVSKKYSTISTIERIQFITVRVNCRFLFLYKNIAMKQSKMTVPVNISINIREAASSLTSGCRMFLMILLPL
jgi:hypothetical protein